MFVHFVFMEMQWNLGGYINTAIYEFHNPFEACSCSDLLIFAAVSIK